MAGPQAALKIDAAARWRADFHSWRWLQAMLAPPIRSTFADQNRTRWAPPIRSTLADRIAMAPRSVARSHSRHGSPYGGDVFGYQSIELAPGIGQQRFFH